MNDSPDCLSEDDRARLDTYLNLVEARIFPALASDAVQNSCSTTLLLIFAAVDALGKLTHLNDKSVPGERLREFLGSLGARYADCSDDLSKLRNALTHNVLNVESYLSSVELEGWTHLQRVEPKGLLYVNTRLMSSDLRQAFAALRVKLATDASAAQSAADRLEWQEVELPEDVGEVRPTPPPPVQFVWAR